MKNLFLVDVCGLEYPYKNENFILLQNTGLKTTSGDALCSAIKKDDQFPATIFLIPISYDEIWNIKSSNKRPD